MPVYDTTPDKVGVLIREHEVLRRSNVESAISTSARIGLRILRKNAPFATGALRDSIEVSDLGRGRTELVFSAPHAAYVEFGVRPHYPPVAPLIRWAEAKGLDNPAAAGRAIAEKIFREGIRPTYFVQRSVPEIVEATRTSVQRVLVKV